MHVAKMVPPGRAIRKPSHPLCLVPARPPRAKARASPRAGPGTRWWQRAPWGRPGSLTSPGAGLVGEPWEPEMREKGLRGLVRLAELRGLAGLLELYVPEGPMATAEKSRNKWVHRGIHVPERVLPSAS